jgi:hypothetical protein
LFNGKQLRALEARIQGLELRLAKLTVAVAQALEALDANAIAVVSLQRWLIAQNDTLPGELPTHERRAH